MDIDGLFWVALLIFYLVTRALKGKKGEGKRPRPAGPSARERRQPVEPREHPRPGQRDELDEALKEIRRALGFPDEEEAPGTTGEGLDTRPRLEPAPTPQPAQSATSQTPSPEPAAEPASMRSVPRPVRAARTASMPAEPRSTQRATSAARPFEPRPAVRAETDGAKAHPFESSFTEEEAFEKMGAHPHAEERPVQLAFSPYQAAQRKKRSNLRKKLAGASSLREAVLMKEVLDRPIFLRRRR